MKKCPYCSELIEEDLSVCPICCEPLPTNGIADKFICPYCAEIINKNTVICPICGENISSTAENDLSFEQGTGNTIFKETSAQVTQGNPPKRYKSCSYFDLVLKHNKR